MHNSASDGNNIKLSEMALAITRMEQRLTMLTTTTTTITNNAAVTPVTVSKQISTKQIINSMMTSQDRVVAATLHNTHFDSNSDNTGTSDGGTMSTDTATSSGYDNSSADISIVNNAGIGPILDITAYNRFEPAIAKLQVHASDIVRVDNAAIGTGGFAKVYKVLLKGDQLCAAKVSVLLMIHAVQCSIVIPACYLNCKLHSVMCLTRLCNICVNVIM
jgi:hypothetical protein